MQHQLPSQTQVREEERQGRRRGEGSGGKGRSSSGGGRRELKGSSRATLFALCWSIQEEKKEVYAEVRDDVARWRRARAGRGKHNAATSQPLTDPPFRLTVVAAAAALQLEHPDRLTLPQIIIQDHVKIKDLFIQG